MTLRLYNILSGGKLMKTIYLPDFLIVMHPLIYGNWIEKNYFAFRMYDGDNDGIISSVDIGDLLKNLIEHCPM
jgi:Ca2+-binding EF-hand superfamily protein